MTRRFPALDIWLLVLLGCTAGCDGSTSTSPSSPVAALQVSQVVPATVPEEDAAVVVITGTGFRSGATVDIGGPATNVSVVDAASIRVTTPVRSAGTFDVVVTNPDGRAARLAQGFTFVPFAVTDLARRSGLPGDVVYVRGTGFRAGAMVTMGGAPARVLERGMSLIAAVAPEHAPGPVDVEVANGSRTETLSGAFTYETVSLVVSARDVASGADLSVAWTAPPGRSVWDWIGLYQVGAADWRFTQWTYTSGAQTGTFVARAPDEPGMWEFRYLVCLDDHSCVEVARSQAVMVRAGGGG